MGILWAADLVRTQDKLKRNTAATAYSLLTETDSGSIQDKAYTLPFQLHALLALVFCGLMVAYSFAFLNLLASFETVCEVVLSRPCLHRLKLSVRWSVKMKHLKDIRSDLLYVSVSRDV